MSVLAHLDASSHAFDRRSTRRRALSLTVDGTPGGGLAAAVVHDISETGLLLETAAELTVGDEIDVVLPRAGTTRASIVWSSGRYLGCAFQAPITPGAISAALLRGEPSGQSSSPAPAPSEAPLFGDATPLSGRFTGRQSFFIIVALSIAAWAIVAIALLA